MSLLKCKETKEALRLARPVVASLAPSNGLKRSSFTFYTLEELEGSQLLPTQETKPGWIHCFRQTGFYPDGTAKSGKWLIFLSLESIDRYWMKIKQAVEQGQLGSEAKVSTAGSRNKQGTHVICVYTYDYRDKDDVMRIRQMLHDLGIKRPIIYKADEDTIKLRYGSDYTPIYRA